MLLKRFLIASLLLGGSLSTASAQVPTLVNFGFETPNVGSNTFGAFQYSPTGAGVGWTFDGSSGVSGNGSGFTSGNPNAPEGAQVGFLQTTGTFSQSFTLDTAVSDFTVSFFGAQRSNAVAQSSFQTFSVAVSGVPLGIFQPTNTAYQSLTTNAISLAAGTYSLTFTGLNPNGGDNTALIDDVRLRATVSVPEASALALLLPTLALIGAVFSRRNRSGLTK